MKKIVLLFATLISIFMMTVSAFASPSYSEWYYDKFGVWPDGTVSEWEYDPVYYEYLGIYDPAELARLRNGEHTDPFNNSGNGGDADAAPVYITDSYWSGSTAKWKVSGTASKYQVTLYKENGSKVTSKTVTSRSVDFSNSFPKDDYYYFEVRAYGKYTESWSGWDYSGTKYFDASSSKSNSNGYVSPSSGSPSGGGYSSYWRADSNGVWHVYKRTGELVTNCWLCDDAAAGNGQNVWYLIDGSGNMISAGLVRDAAGNYYSLETEHNGHFGMMRYASGTYGTAGGTITLSLENQHNGRFGAINNQDAITRLSQNYGVTDISSISTNLVYTSRF